MDPPPSLAFASGRYPALTAAEAPPDDPPDVCSTFQGFAVSPKIRDSVLVVQSEFWGMGLTEDHESRAAIACDEFAFDVWNRVFKKTRSVR